MWTYLVILAAVLVLVGVYIRRWRILVRGGEQKAKVAEQKAFEKAEKAEKAVGADAPKEVVKGLGEEQEEAKSLTKSDLARARALSEDAEKKIKGGKEDEAIKLLVQALAIDAMHMETQHRLAMLYMNKQMYGAAAALFEQLGEAEAEMAAADRAVHFSHLGLALYHQQDLEGARDAYQRAVDLDESRPARFVSLAQVYRGLGELNAALCALDKAVKMDGENLDFLLLLADIQREIGASDEALEIVKAVLDLDGKNEHAKALLKELEG